jgi:hypothetical protein
MRRLILASLALTASTILLSGGAFAQSAPSSAPASAPAPKPTPLPVVRGHVASFSGDALKVDVMDNGGSKSFTLNDKTRIILVHRITLDEIKPGSFVATANVDQPDGSGVSTELRVFEGPLVGLGEGHYPMSGRPAGTQMTNGTVTSQVVSTPRGREMDVSYTNQDGKKGVRHITVPADMVITAWDPGSRTDIQPGRGVQVRSAQLPDGSVITTGVLISNSTLIPPLI